MDVAEEYSPVSTPDSRISDEKHFQAVWEFASDAMALSDPQAVVLAANPAYLQLYGYSAEEVIGHNFAVIFPAGLREWANEEYHKTFADPNIAPAVETTIHRKDGTERMVEAHYTFVMRGQERTAMISIVRDITDQKRAEANEREARLQAERAVLDRERLVSIVAHDLRNPLTSIQGTAQMLTRRLSRNEALDRERLKSMAGQIERSAVQMNSLITEILDFSKVQAGVPLSLSNRSMDLVELVEHVAEECRQRSPRYEILVASDVPHLVAEWDPSRLERVFSNLLDNAIKYSPQGAAIKVVIQMEGISRRDAGEKDRPERVLVKVKDHGIGIPAADLPHIFKWYRRGGNADEWAKGTGIGLAGALHIVEQYGGAIAVESVEGEGSTFTISLPLPAAT
jgi:PAS domain S-box-containing protein